MPKDLIMGARCAIRSQDIPNDVQPSLSRYIPVSLPRNTKQRKLRIIKAATRGNRQLHETTTTISVYIAKSEGYVRIETNRKIASALILIPSRIPLTSQHR